MATVARYHSLCCLSLNWYNIFCQEFIISCRILLFISAGFQSTMSVCALFHVCNIFKSHWSIKSLKECLWQIISDNMEYAHKEILELDKSHARWIENENIINQNHIQWKYNSGQYTYGLNETFFLMCRNLEVSQVINLNWISRVKALNGFAIF